MNSYDMPMPFPDSLHGAVGAARLSQKHAYAPYSGKFVGAAVLTRSGRVFAGCNVENKSDDLRVCAERNAIGAAVAAGEREIIAVVVVSPDNRLWPPCAACRQVIEELALNAEIVMCNKNGVVRRASLHSLPPVPFDPPESGRT
jgi:cytidine deaminase